MSCKNSDQGCSNNYKVQINTDKNLVGYAWSSNIGWIKFGGLGTPPSGGGFSGQARVEYTTDNSTNANVNTDWELQGWARACAGAAKANCTGGVHPSAGGWGGWISLGGTATNGSSYSVKIKDDAGTLDRSASSAAWGSTVVGWVDFRDVYIDLTTTPTDPDPKICTKAAAPDKCVGDNLIKYDLFCGKKTIDCSVASAASGLTADGGTCEVKGGKPQCVDKIIPTKTPVGNLVATFSATPPWVRKGDNVEFTWSITGDDTTCRVKGSDGDWYSDFKDSNDGATVSETSSKSIDLNLTVFTLWCKTAAADPLEALDTSKVNGGDPVEVNLIPGVYES